MRIINRWVTFLCLSSLLLLLLLVGGFNHLEKYQPMGRIIPYIMEKKFETTSQLCSSSGTIKDMSLHSENTILISNSTSAQPTVGALVETICLRTPKKTSTSSLYIYICAMYIYIYYAYIYICYAHIQIDRQIDRWIDRQIDRFPKRQISHWQHFINQKPALAIPGLQRYPQISAFGWFPKIGYPLVN